MKSSVLVLLFLLSTMLINAQDVPGSDILKPDYIIADELYQLGLITHDFPPFPAQGAVAGISSLLITGAGQAVNGQFSKGVLLLIGNISGILVAITAQEDNTFLLGIGISAGCSLISVADAAIIGSRNYKTFNDHRIREYDRIIRAKPLLGYQLINDGVNNAVLPTIGCRFSF